MAGRWNHRAGDAGAATGLIGRRELLAGGFVLGLAGTAKAGVSTLPDVDIPVRIDNNQLWTGVWLDKQGPFRFAVASGANAFRIWEGLATKAKLNPMPNAAALRSGATANFYQVEELLIGGACALTKVPLASWRQDFPPKTVGALPLIQDRVTVFDWQGGMMRSLKERPADRAGHERVELVYESKWPVWTPVVRAKVAGKDVRLRVDTGYRGPVNLFGNTVQSLGLWDGAGPFYDRHNDYNGDKVTVRTARRGDLEIGGVRIAAPLMDLDRGAAGRRDTSIDGVIGMEVLRRMAVMIDQPRRDLWLKPLANFEEGWNHDRAGFNADDKDGAWFVTQIDAGSPAERSGLKVGDRILTDMDSVMDARYAPAGAQIGFTVDSGGQRRKVSMTLENRL